jgi:hypothetical protein
MTLEDVLEAVGKRTKAKESSMASTIDVWQSQVENVHYSIFMKIVFNAGKYASSHFCMVLDH